MLLRRFREQLGSSEWAERERVPLTAGLAILQVIARRIDPQVTPDATDVGMARAVVRTLPQNPTARALKSLLRVVDEDPPGPAGPALMEYGKTLEDSSAYDLAADVYQLAAELGRREHGLQLAPAALVRVGACLRNVGRYREAERAYRAAAALAQEIGDTATELLSHIGRAKIAIEQYRYVVARAQLDRVIDQARARDLRHPLAIALHDRGALANREDHLDDALVYLAEALVLQRDQGEQIRVLTDVGVTARKLGLIDIAHDVFACVHRESQQQDIQWSASINLMAVAMDRRCWEEFDRLRQGLESATLSPYRQCEFLGTLGEGLAIRGLDADARAIYHTLADTARQCEYAEFEQLAERALNRETVGRTAPLHDYPLPSRCRPAIDAIRERVLASCSN